MAIIWRFRCASKDASRQKVRLANFSLGKKNLELHWGRGKFEVESGPLGRGPEICQHLTQQGASKGFYTLRML